MVAAPAIVVHLDSAAVVASHTVGPELSRAPYLAAAQREHDAAHDTTANASGVKQRTARWQRRSACLQVVMQSRCRIPATNMNLATAAS